MRKLRAEDVIPKGRIVMGRPCVFFLLILVVARKDTRSVAIEEKIGEARSLWRVALIP
jgi:hypothetical protein